MPEIQTYKPFPRQQEFHRNPAKYRLFGGQAGPGKSRALTEEAGLHVWRHPGCSVLLLRRTFPELEKSIINPFLINTFPQWKAVGASYNSQKHFVSLPNGSFMYFGHCVNEKDITQYQGSELLYIGFDELTMFTLFQWQYMTSRNRCSIPGTFPCMAGASNPGDIGHEWVKALFIDHKTVAGMERPEEYDPNEYAFIKATLEDNPVYANDVNYIKTLDALPSHLYKAFRLGDWNIHAGQYFSNFRPSHDDGTERHVIDGRLFKIESWWPKWISIDWGFHHPAAVYWHTRDDDGKIYTYRELHGKGIGETDLGFGIAGMTMEENVTSVFLGPDAYAKRGEANSAADQIAIGLKQGGLPYPSRADTDRVGGARLMYQLLQTDQWAITDNCQKLIECIPTMLVDSDNVEDVLKVDAGEGKLGDDPYDSARYGLKSMLHAKKPPFDEVMRQKLKPIEDPTSRAIFAMKMNADHMKLKRFDGANLGASRLRWMRGAR